MFFDNFKFSNSASKRLTMKNILGYFDNEVEGQTHHVSALFFDILRSLKIEEYEFLAKKLSEKHFEIINFVAVNADELTAKKLLVGIGKFSEVDLIYVYKTIDNEFMSNAMYTVEVLFELSINFHKAKISTQSH